MGIRSTAVPGLFDDVAAELAEVEEALYTELQADPPLLREMATHLLKAGGKRLRPALVLLAARSFDYRREHLIPVAAAVEMIHMATLVHDDIVDGATLRRGLPTPNVKWGDGASVLLGDYLFARAFSMLAGTGDNRVVRVMADVVFRMSGGEIEQMAEAHNLDRDETAYLDQIEKKTAYFIGECCRVGALVAGAPEDAAEALFRYGYDLGMGFQIVDDILDMIGSPRELGKSRGTDVQSGILTLPVIHSLRTTQQADELREILRSRPLEDRDLDRIQDIVTSCGALDYAYQTALRFTQEAKENLRRIPEGRVRDRLMEIAEFVARRRF